MSTLWLIISPSIHPFHSTQLIRRHYILQFRPHQLLPLPHSAIGLTMLPLPVKTREVFSIYFPNSSILLQMAIRSVSTNLKSAPLTILFTLLMSASILLQESLPAFPKNGSNSFKRVAYLGLNRRKTRKLSWKLLNSTRKMLSVMGAMTSFSRKWDTHMRRRLPLRTQIRDLRLLQPHRQPCQTNIQHRSHQHLIDHHLHPLLD